MKRARTGKNKNFSAAREPHITVDAFYGLEDERGRATVCRIVLQRKTMKRKKQTVKLPSFKTRPKRSLTDMLLNRTRVCKYG